ncbi:MAG: TM2 domain-containing protein [Eubacterium sp.]|nr:TM2 domain-containing protein [Eubacterium sp.]
MHPILKLVITYFFGIFGVHKFIEGDKKKGVLYLCTLGLLGFGWIYDVVIAVINVIKYYSGQSSATISNGNAVLGDDGNMYTKLRAVTKDCVNVEGLNRQFALEHIDEHTRVHLQEYNSNGYDVFLVVTDEGIDLGEISNERSLLLKRDFADKMDEVVIKDITGGKGDHYLGCNVVIKMK